MLNRLLHWSLALAICVFVLQPHVAHAQDQGEGAPAEAPGAAEVGALIQRADSLFRVGRIDASIPVYRRVLEIQPEHGRAAFVLHHAYAALGLFDEAKRWLRHARTLDPEGAWSGSWHCFLANVASMEGGREAVAMHTDSLLAAASPEAPVAWSCAAMNRVYLGEYAEAKRLIERYRAEAPEKHAPLAHYGFVLLQTGEEERAAELLQGYEAQRRQEIADDPGKWDAYFALAEIAAIRGDADAAVRHLKEAIRQGAGDEFWLYYALSDETGGDPLWAGVRGHPEFERLLAERRAEIERMRARVLEGETGQAELGERLDSLARAALAQETVAGFSVAVLQGPDTLLLKGYGQADVGLDVPATEETKYRLVGPTETMLATLVMQLVEQGRLSLDEDITPLLPDFPWQGRRVTVRQLLDATSGLPDYHYLGDPYESEIAVPKSIGEVTALFAGRPFMHEPGERQQWTISGFHLAGVLLERLTGKRFQELLDEQIARPLGLEQTSYCNTRAIIPGLATSYGTAGDSLIQPSAESPTVYPFAASVCASAGDVATLYRALRDGRLLEPESYAEMIRLSPAAQEHFEREGWGLTPGFLMMEVGGKRRVGTFGGLHIGFTSSAFYVPEDALTVVVLANTWSGQVAEAVASRLTRATLNLPVPEFEPPPAPLHALPVSAEERSRYTGTYQVQWTDPPAPYQYYQRTYRVFEEHGQLMLQARGAWPERLLKQDENTFALARLPRVRVTFTVKDGRATTLSYQYVGSEPFQEGPRIADGE